jgi:hypothetical protein
VPFDLMSCVPTCIATTAPSTYWGTLSKERLMINSGSRRKCLSWDWRLPQSCRSAHRPDGVLGAISPSPEIAVSNWM